MASKHPQPISIQVFISTDDEACTDVKDFMESWIKDHDGIQLEFIPILENPIRLIRLGITHTPAIVVDNKVMVQECSVNEVRALLLKLAG